jgi:hypothetical protein
MNDLERFAGLAARARQEQPPPLDVAAAVLGRIGDAEAMSPSSRESSLLLACSALSAIAATVMAALALQAYEMLSGPLGGMFQSLTVIQ